MQLSIVELGVLFAHYKSFFGHLSSEERGKNYLRAAGFRGKSVCSRIRLHILEELKERNTNYHFPLKIGVLKPDYRED